MNDANGRKKFIELDIKALEYSFKPGNIVTETQS